MRTTKIARMSVVPTSVVPTSFALTSFALTSFALTSFALTSFAVMGLGCGDDGSPSLATTRGTTTSASSTSSDDAVTTSGASTTSGTSTLSGTSVSASSTSATTTSGVTTDEPPFETEGADDTWGTTGDCGFTCPTPPNPGAACSVSLQDCVEGEKCAPWANDGSIHWNSTRCFSLDEDPDGLGEACAHGGVGAGIDSCDVGLWCRPVAGGEVEGGPDTGVCAALCSGGTSVCPTGETCVRPGTANVGTCGPLCDPLDPQSCEQGHGCVPAGLGFACTYVQSHEDGSCSFSNDCADGALCLLEESSPTCDSDGCCASSCDLQDPQCPLEAPNCVAYGSPLSAYEHVGHCQATQ